MILKSPFRGAFSAKSKKRSKPLLRSAIKKPKASDNLLKSA
ncbi:hypothetical protein N409_08300 [Helicobacter pylori FD719]|nr:hypothetical protein N409_08300 [Helicobacter pylori FD719]